MNKLYIVGIGPGEHCKMTIEAENILNECEVIAGYKTYIDIVKPYFKDKEYISTGMKQEEERCRLALESASQGRKTAVICSGDAGIYGMSGLVMELSKDYPNVEIKAVAGVTAALSGGALAGSPLGHDFAVISLSDLLTPWEKIKERLSFAAKADFAICIYNPSSKTRHDYLKKACDIILEYRNTDTVCACVRNIGREGEECKILTLSELRDAHTDMFTTVFIGNSQTKKIGNYMVTPRGYRLQEV